MPQDSNLKGRNKSTRAENWEWHSLWSVRRRSDAEECVLEQVSGCLTVVSSFVSGGGNLSPLDLPWSPNGSLGDSSRCPRKTRVSIKKKRAEVRK